MESLSISAISLAPESLAVERKPRLQVRLEWSRSTEPVVNWYWAGWVPAQNEIFTLPAITVRLHRQGKKEEKKKKATWGTAASPHADVNAGQSGYSGASSRDQFARFECKLYLNTHLVGVCVCARVFRRWYISRVKKKKWSVLKKTQILRCSWRFSGAKFKGRLCHYGCGGAPSSVVCVLSVVSNLFRLRVLIFFSLHHSLEWQRTG